AFEPSLEALQHSHRVPPSPARIRWYRRRGGPRGRAHLTRCPGGGRDGRRARVRSACPRGREGSNTSSPPPPLLRPPAVFSRHRRTRWRARWFTVIFLTNAWFASRLVAAGGG